MLTNPIESAARAAVKADLGHNSDQAVIEKLCAMLAFYMKGASPGFMRLSSLLSAVEGGSAEGTGKRATKTVGHPDRRGGL